MGLVISKGLTFRQQTQTLDADAQAYVNAVEVADGQRIEDPVRFAINDFVLGCKADGIWNAIKASCILAGARTLAGALQPLVGAAPTNVGGLFVSGDYNRKTGLVGDGSTKYLNSNRNNNLDPQNSFSMGVVISQADTITGTLAMGNGVDTAGDSSLAAYSGGSRCRTAAQDNAGAAGVTGFFGISRNSSASYTQRRGGANASVTRVSQTPANLNISIFAGTRSPQLHTNMRAQFYWIGESLNLALLDARVTDLINAFGAAIPS